MVWLLTLLLGVTASDWPQWRGPIRNGYQPSGPALRKSLPGEGLQPVWIVKEIPGGNSGGWSSPVVAGGRVYVFIHEKDKNSEETPPEKKFPWLPEEKRVGMSDEEYKQYEINRRDEEERIAKYFSYNEQVRCYDLATGSSLWTWKAPSVYCRFVQSGTPAISGNRLLVLGAGRMVRCLDLTEGKLQWETRLPGSFRDEFFDGSFLIVDQTAVIPAGQLYGLDIQSGKLLWEVGDDPTNQTHGSPAVYRAASGASVVIANLGGGVTAGIQLADGKQLWKIDSGANNSSPIVVGTRLLTYGSSRKSGLRCFELGDGTSEPTEVWAFQRSSDSGSSPVVVGDQVYVQGERRIACVDLETGKSRWQTDIKAANPRYTSLVAGDKQVIYGWDGILVFEANPDSYQMLYQAKIDREGVLIAEEDLRKRLKLDELPSTAEGQTESEKLWTQAVGKGPLQCSTPVLVDGRLIVRLADGLGCWDLRP